MDKLEQDLQQNNQVDYNTEPVVYCKRCLSLAIRTEEGVDYCDKCGSTETESANIFDWEKMYATKYGGSYINK